MKPAVFEYAAPTDLKQATTTLRTAQGEVRMLAGGQTLGPMLNMRLAMPSLLVDIGRIDVLRRIEERGDRLVIGAAVTHATLEDRADPTPLGRLLSHVASTIAYRAIRNRGTIGGSLAHADPAADWVTTMTLLGADISVAGPTGTRRIAMPDFMRGVFTTALQSGEMIVAVEIPKLSVQTRWGYYKICRKIGEFPEAIGAVLLDPDGGLSRVIAGALDGPPMSLPVIAERVAHEGAAAAAPEFVRAAMAAAVPALDSVDLQLHAAAVRRAILQAVGS